MKKTIVLMALAALISSCADRSLEATVTAQNGQNGVSCMAQNAPGGALISCSDGSQAFVSNGTDGTNGQNGTNGINGTNGTNGTSAVIDYIYPCGTEFANDEVFLRLADGSILAVYDGGNLLSRLVRLSPGNYVTTDRTGAQCQVNVDSNLNVTTSPTAATGAALR